MTSGSKAALERDNYQCVVCGTTQNVHSHHVTFRSLGGGNESDNYATLCASCHDDVHSHRIELVPALVEGTIHFYTKRKRP